tara:strand:+ start:12779 stop:14314 length:1536 start_codon:yes stop_codon:yes gene_type:complete
MAINNLGNGSGYLYITNISDEILSNIVNNNKGMQSVLKEALINATLADNSTSITGDRKYFINTAGTEGSIAGATDITNYVTSIGLNNRFLVDDATIATGVIPYTRKGSIQRLRIDTQGATATDNVFRITETNAYATDGDILIIVGESSARVVTVLDKGSAEAATDNSSSAPTGVGILALDSAAAFSTSDDKFSLMLQYNADNDIWYEINRAPGAVITDAKLRAANINIPKNGTELITSIVAAGSFTPTVDTTSGIIHVSGTHDISAGAYTINLPTGGTPLEGDEFTVVWNANLTTTGVVTVFSSVLSSANYGTGATETVEIKTRYIGGVWKAGTVIKDTKAITEDVEPLIPNPTSTGQFLTSNTDGVRSWSTINTGIKILVFKYDFGVYGGEIGTIELPVSTSGQKIPSGAILLPSMSVIENIVVPVGESGATVKVGLLTSTTSDGSLATDDDYFMASTTLASSPYSTLNGIKKGVGVAGKLAGTGFVTVTLGVGNVTSGEFNIIVAYYES